LLTLRSEAVNNSRLNQNDVLGNFCGQPIITLDTLGAEADDEADLHLRLMLSSHNSVPAEILPGEVLCKDNVIRRSTAVEVIGYDTYHNQEQIEAGTQRGSIELGRLAALAGKLVHFRPNRFVGVGEYALITVDEGD
jgi:hypothetical protein